MPVSMKSKGEQTILGIDPGTAILGFGVIRVTAKAAGHGSKPELVDAGVVNLKKEGSHFLVLQRILIEISKIIQKYRPDLIAIEAPFYGKNPQVMLKLGRAQGAAIAAGLLKDIPIYEYAPRSVKLAVTGKGAASKTQVSNMVQMILRFKSEVKYLDATDALAIALCHFYSEKSINTIASAEDLNIRLSKLGGRKSGAADSMRMGRLGLSNVHSGSRNESWENFVKNNPERLQRVQKTPKSSKKTK